MQKSQNCKLIFPKKSLEMSIKRILILIISFWLVQVNHSTDRSCWWFLGWQRVLWYWYRYNIRVLFLVAPSPATRPDQSNWGGSMNFKGVKLAYRPTDNFFKVCTAARSPTFLCLTHKTSQISCNNLTLFQLLPGSVSGFCVYSRAEEGLEASWLPLVGSDWSPGLATSLKATGMWSLGLSKPLKLRK